MTADLTEAAPDYNAIPADFPRPKLSSALAGMQPKLAMVEFRGQFYTEGCSPPEVWARWDGCEDLAKQMAAKAEESKQGKRAHMTEEEILAQYLPLLICSEI
jgi:hypothetical protein